MAVEARHPSLFPPQFLPINGENMHGIDRKPTVYSGAPIGYGGGVGMPLVSGITTDTFLPVYGSTTVADSVPAKPHPLITDDDSVLTYSHLPVSRKRIRDSIDSPLLSFPTTSTHQDQIHYHHNRSGSFSFLGEDISTQIQHQQLEIDNFIAQHTEKIRAEIEERRQRSSRRIIAAVEEGIVKKLRSKEEEIEKIGKLNWALEEKVKSLSVENQIWRELAQTNEATANALRSNLEQVLAHVQDDHRRRRHRAGESEAADMTADDAQSRCGSNINDEEEERRTLAENVVDKRNGDHHRLCRKCGKVEACVLLLPCRHLCVCTVCGSSLHTCPICKSTKNASVHVNM